MLFGSFFLIASPLNTPSQETAFREKAISILPGGLFRPTVIAPFSARSIWRVNWRCNCFSSRETRFPFLRAAIMWPLYSNSKPKRTHAFARSSAGGRRLSPFTPLVYVLRVPRAISIRVATSDSLSPRVLRKASNASPNKSVKLSTGIVSMIVDNLPFVNDHRQRGGLYQWPRETAETQEWKSS